MGRWVTDLISSPQLTRTPHVKPRTHFLYMSLHVRDEPLWPHPCTPRASDKSSWFFGDAASAGTVITGGEGKEESACSQAGEEGGRCP